VCQEKNIEKNTGYGVVPQLRVFLSLFGLLPIVVSLRGRSPSGAEPGPEGKEGLGEIFRRICILN